MNIGVIVLKIGSIPNCAVLAEAFLSNFTAGSTILIAMMLSLAVYLAYQVLKERKLKTQFDAKINELDFYNKTLTADNEHLTLSKLEMVNANKGLEEELQKRTQELSDINSRIESQLGNITKIEEEIKQQRNALEIANNDLLQLTYVSSHDLQEPLRIVTNYVQLLERKYGDILDDDAKEYIEFANKGAKQAQRLITDLRQYAMLNKKASKVVQIDMVDLIKRIEGKLKKKYPEKKFKIIHNVVPYCNGVQEHFCQIFYNLIENGLRFCDEDIAIINVESLGKNGMLRFAISDNGMGIKKEYQNKVFYLFHKLNDKHASKGSGIGLSMCKKIVEMSGGEIWFEPRKTKGTTFFFNLPNVG